ncbi:helix-turn-helix domain-containing protein [Nocardia puris]|uniref:helix-turn-helix domain-containing protein n=1 Tax=Nocardia puris TaxID=208602 RepID=UPI00189542DB|nr:helix-turn-helix domain-containing protein [Nocardia puris]MBF6185035.1 helix-turn-helix domain-containing protein [Nocardia farcinica]MBF6363997.1 helix-turn-helix domain-containing protein [Nocardia farcinica]MBF6463209.1 helix-turn-helix domain-containing protein [Nocardia puris]
MHHPPSPTTIKNRSITPRVSLPSETRELLRALGTVAIKLADDGTAEADWLRNQIPRLPGDPTRGGVGTPDLLTIPETCSRLRLSRWSVYQLIHRRELASIKIGRRRFVPAGEADRFLSQLINMGARP